MANFMQKKITNQKIRLMNLIFLLIYTLLVNLKKQITEYLRSYFVQSYVFVFDLLWLTVQKKTKFFIEK